LLSTWLHYSAILRFESVNKRPYSRTVIVIIYIVSRIWTN